MFRKTSLGFWLIFCHFYILNINSLECIRGLLTLFWTGYEINKFIFSGNVRLNDPNKSRYNQTYFISQTTHSLKVLTYKMLGVVTELKIWRSRW